ncbi:hypothetical protein [Anatilimnocola floriformis]|uniref:hypothetical protein n=1 Tax=Anatilimnocola floriformis TaxID=2948575 RepID=UPI0020C4938A|nr:hypothetical protein [Anatilimnocola floriformis]
MSHEPNPYASPNFSELPTSNLAGGKPELSASILVQQRVISILMIIQGILSAIVGGGCIVAAFILPKMIAADMRRQPGGPNLEQMELIMLITYSVMGCSGILPGLLLVYAGFQNLWLRGHVLGIVAICGGVLALGTCYCLPTALALLIYGLIIYLNETTKRAFLLAREGKSYNEIMQLATSSQNRGT